MEDKKVKKMPKAKEPEVFKFTPGNAEELIAMVSKIPLNALTYVQYINISELQGKAQKVVDLYRQKSAKILKDNGLESISPNTALSDVEQDVLKQLMEEYNKDSEAFTSEDLGIFSSQEMGEIFEHTKDKLSFQEFKALNYYLLKK